MAEKPPIETVDGVINEKDRPWWRKIYDFLFAESIEDVKKDVLKDIIGPYIKDFFFDVLTGSVERSIYGSNRTSYSLRNGPSRAPLRPGQSRASWEGYYKGSKSSVSSSDDLYDPIIMETKAQAQRLLEILRSRIDKYGNTTINELNDCLKRIGHFTDEYYGWTNLDDAFIKRLSMNEYQVILPEPKQLSKKEKTYVDL